MVDIHTRLDYISRYKSKSSQAGLYVPRTMDSQIRDWTVTSRPFIASFHGETIEVGTIGRICPGRSHLFPILDSATVWIRRHEL